MSSYDAPTHSEKADLDSKTDFTKLAYRVLSSSLTELLLNMVDDE